MEDPQTPGPRGRDLSRYFVDVFRRIRRLKASPSQTWSQWEEDSAWSDSSLTAIETSFPKMHQGGDPEELSVYRVVFLSLLFMHMVFQTLRAFLNVPFCWF